MLSNIDDFLRLSIEEIPSCDDKLEECRYFLSLAASEENIEHFRWLTSAFLSAARSFIEIRVRHFCISNFGESAERQPQSLVLDEFKGYIDAKIDKNDKILIRSSHEIIGLLICLRNSNSHHNSLLIKNHHTKGGSPDQAPNLQISTKNSLLVFMRSAFDVLQELNTIE